MQNQKTNSMSKQRDLQALFAQKQERAAELFSEKLKTQRFEYGQLSDQWKELASVAIRKVSPLSNKVGMDEFAYAASYDRNSKQEPTLFQFGVLSNSLEAVSIEDLGLTNEEYLDFITEATGYVKMYAERMMAIRKAAEEQAEKEFKTKIAAISQELAEANKLKAEA